MNFTQYSQIQNIDEFSKENEISFIQNENIPDEYSLINSYMQNEKSLLLSEIVNRRETAEKTYKAEKISGNFKYLQTQLCATMPSGKCYGKSFVHYLNTPFGTIYLLFRYFPRSNRYTRFVLGGGKYIDLIKKLDSKYKSEVERIKIYNIILDYLNSEPSRYDAWKSPCFVQGIDDKDLAYFCAIVSVCDPCYGKGENGGKDIRTVLRSKECQKGCKFEKFLDPRFYPLSQRRAYSIYREYQDKKLKRSLEGTKRAINRTTKFFSTSKPKAISRLNKLEISSQGVINFDCE